MKNLLSILQARQMKKFSQIHNENYLEITKNLFSISRRYYYNELAGKSVLDIGNGGITKEFLLGKSLAKKVPFFYRMDKSGFMLKRNGLCNDQIIADARNTPLKDNAVDYVVANYLPHHFGMSRTNIGTQALEDFFEESVRISRTGVIISEMIIPRPLELLQSVFLLIFRFMPTFVYSRKTLLKAIANCNLEITEIREYSIVQFVSPFSLFSPIIDFPWLKVPAFLIPYRYIYFVVKKHSTKN